MFDLHYPGEGTRLAVTPSKKSRDGLKGARHTYKNLNREARELITNSHIGIISALAFCNSYDPSYRLYAAGSLSPSSANSANIALFDEDTGERPVGWVGNIQASVVQVCVHLWHRCIS